MEPFVIGAWLLLSLAAVSTCLVRRPGHPRSSRDRCKRDIAVLCILTLLFPFIAMADDWCYECYDQCSALEASSLSKHSATATPYNATACDNYKSALALAAPATAQNPLRRVLGLVAIEELQNISSPQVGRRPGRAPPSSDYLPSNAAA